MKIKEGNGAVNAQIHHGNFLIVFCHTFMTVCSLLSYVS